MRAVLAAVAMAMLAAGAAHAAGTKAVKDWLGVCDNRGDCQAFGFSAEDADAEQFRREFAADRGALEERQCVFGHILPKPKAAHQ